MRNNRSDVDTMNDKTMLRTGAAGSIIAIVCCFTPALVILLGAVGLSAILGWVDYVLFPVLFASLGLMAFALHKRANHGGPSPRLIIIATVIVFSALIVWLEFRYALRISIVAILAVTVFGYFSWRRGREKEAPQ